MQAGCPGQGSVWEKVGAFGRGCFRWRVFQKDRHSCLLGDGVRTVPTALIWGVCGCENSWESWGLPRGLC